jgi:hypothetical protein
MVADWQQNVSPHLRIAGRLGLDLGAGTRVGIVGEGPLNAGIGTEAGTHKLTLILGTIATFRSSWCFKIFTAIQSVCTR